MVRETDEYTMIHPQYEIVQSSYKCLAKFLFYNMMWNMKNVDLIHEIGPFYVFRVTLSI